MTKYEEILKEEEKRHQKWERNQAAGTGFIAGMVIVGFMCISMQGCVREHQEAEMAKVRAEARLSACDLLCPRSP